MATSLVVVFLNPRKRVLLQSLEIWPRPGMDEFLLVGRKERFRNRVIVTNPGTTQRSTNLVFPTILSKIRRRILTGFNQSMQHRYFLEIVAVR